MKKETIIEIVCNHFNTTFAEVYETKGSRDENLVLVRHFIYLFLKLKTKSSLSSIGKTFNQGHSNVYTSIKNLNGRIETNSKLSNDYFDIEKQIDSAKEKNKITFEQLIEIWVTRIRKLETCKSEKGKHLYWIMVFRMVNILEWKEKFKL